MKALVIKAHIPEPAQTISPSRGDLLACESRPTVYPGWIWCTDQEGNQAWAPEAYLAKEGNSCRFLRDYNSSELEIEAGAEVEVVERTSGWALIRETKTRQGWIPLDCLRMLEL